MGSILQLIVHLFPRMRGNAPWEMQVHHHQLAAWMDAKGFEYRGAGLKGVVTSSESLLPEQRATIIRRFGCPVFDWYGQFESVAAVGTCERGQYHLVADYSAVELLPSGEDVVVCLGDGARRTLGSANLPVEAAVLGIVDRVHLADDVGRRPLEAIGGQHPPGHGSRSEAT